MDVTIIIVNWNTGILLKQCIDSLPSALKDVSYHVVVIDNASSDHSVEFLARVPSRTARLICNSRNHGFAAANNQGYEYARGRYILLLNPDTVPQPGSLACLVQFMDRNACVGAAGPRLVDNQGHIQPSCSRFPTLRNLSMEATGLSKLFARTSFFARTTMTFWDHNTERDVDVVSGACLLVRSEAVRRVGFLDERFYVYYEETDLCLRLKNAGWLVRFCADAAVIHFGGQSSINNLDVRITARYRSIFYFYAKHYPAWHLYVLRVLLVFELVWRTVALITIGIPSLRRHKKRQIFRRYSQAMAALMSGGGS